MNIDFNNIIQELKRRRVFRVAAVYSGFAFIIFQIIDATFDTLGIPQWLGKYTIVALILGFPIAVGLGWAFDITDKGLVRTKDKPLEHDSRKPFVGNLSLSIVAAIAILLALWGWMKNPQVRTEGYQSIAVLPFDNYMGDESQNYFVDGMTESIIAELARLEGLRVISRTSVMQYRNTEKVITDIARELGVDAIVEGSVLKAGNEVRITAQLIDGITDEHLWANSFEKKLDQILTLQREVASAIAEEIKWTFNPEDEEYFQQDEIIVDSDAYELYLKGWNERLLEKTGSAQQALNYFNAAILLDSTLYQAHAAKVVTLFLDGDEVNNEDLAHHAVKRTLEIAPDAAESWMAQAMYSQLFDLDISGAGEAFKKAIEARPGDAEFRREYGLYFLRLGLFDEAIVQLEISLAYNPKSALCLRDLGQLYVRVGRGDEGMALIDQSLEIEPDNHTTEELKGLAWLAINQPQKAYAHYLYLEKKYDWYHKGLQVAMIRSGNAEQIYARMDSIRYVLDPSNHFLDAATNSVLGHIDEAIIAFERWTEQRSPRLMLINEDPLWDPIRHRPEYKRVLRELGFPDNQPEPFSDMLTRLYGPPPE